ncbi:MAG: isoprenylcysteine carboxylmethyltransferase family protein [Anaerolineales bacterium]|nr:isoprenylcysteine carboxylmethyltransferase family protein [Anaerolineales bacterium]
MNDNIFRIFAAVIFLTGLSISIYFRSKADKDSGEKVSFEDEGRAMFLTLRIGGLVLWLSMLGYLIYPPLLAWSKVGLAEWARWLGVGLGVACVFLIYWMFSSIGTGITPTVATRSKHKLVTKGPYRWIRHPLYTFGTLFFLSFALMADSWFIALMAMLAIVLLTIRLPNEEAHLIEKFGDEYSEYMKRTGRYLPKLG